jgi:glycosyltransferase involved in cell wall biosynthesis
MDLALASNSNTVRTLRHLGRRLRIAQIAPLYESVPPRLYGGTERVVAYLTDALVELGHEVTLFASGDSTTRAGLCASRKRALRLDDAPLKSDFASHLTMLHDVRERQSDFDVLHFHTDILHLPLFEEVAAKTVTTLHGRLDLPELPGVFDRWPQYPLVSISDHQRLPMPAANWIATVAHGLPLDLYPAPGDPTGDYLVFVGRIAPEKRPDRAIRIARRAGMRLKIAAKVDAVDVRYFNDVIEPLIDEPGVEFLGELAERDNRALLANAAALLFPIDWPEPFGLVMIEALGCGTPVIAWRCGSVPEVIDDGSTGFIVDSEDAAVAACGRVGEIDRSHVRHAFEARFSARAMATRYLGVYRQLAGVAAAREVAQETA